MVRSTLLVSLLAAASTALGGRPDIKKGKSRVPGAFIFEFDDEHVRATRYGKPLYQSRES